MEHRIDPITLACLECGKTARDMANDRSPKPCDTISAAAARLKAAIHELSLHGSQSRDEARALGGLSYYLTAQTADKLVRAVRGMKP